MEKVRILGRVNRKQWLGNKLLHFLFLSLLFITLVVLVLYILMEPVMDSNECDVINFEEYNNTEGGRADCFFVPNIVHFIRIDKPTFTFVEAVCILAAVKHQNPEKLYIHTNLDRFSGYYWKILQKSRRLKRILVITRVEMPVEMMRKQNLTGYWMWRHAYDMLRLSVLAEYGGIYLDNDSYLVQSLDELRRYEMTVGWSPLSSDPNKEVVLAHRKARLLRRWLDTYLECRPFQWFENGCVRPAGELLGESPHESHLEVYGLANRLVSDHLFRELWLSWTSQWVIHILADRLVGLEGFPFGLYHKFNRTTLHGLPEPFKQMVDAVYPKHLYALHDF